MNSTADKKNVLIVDDHALTRFGLKTALQTRQDVYNKILEAESGEQGIELSRDFKPDLVIMDLQLPGINGIEATKAIKKLYSTAKIIILTSHSSEEHVLKAVSAGAQAYCLKDIEPERLLNLLDMVCEGAAWFDPAVSKCIIRALATKHSGQPYYECESGNRKNPLTDREKDVLKLIVEGYNNAEISEKLCVSIHTAKAHVCNILHKLSVDDRTQAAIRALKDGFI